MKANWVNDPEVALTSLKLRAHMCPWRLYKVTPTENWKEKQYILLVGAFEATQRHFTSCVVEWGSFCLKSGEGTGQVVAVKQDGEVGGSGKQESSWCIGVYVGIWMVYYRGRCCSSQFWKRWRHGSGFLQQRKRVMGGDRLCFLR